MSRKKKCSGHSTPAAAQTDHIRDRVLPSEVVSYLSHIRALIIAGNIEKAAGSLSAFQSRFGSSWFEIEEIRELREELNRLRPGQGWQEKEQTDFS